MKTYQVLIIGTSLAMGLIGCSGDSTSDNGGPEDPGSPSSFACSSGFVDGVTSSTMSACNNCSVLESGAAIDGDPNSAATVNFGINGGQLTFGATAPEGKTFSGTVEAGALMLFPENQSGGFVNVGVRFNTYLDGSPVDSNVGGTTTGVGNIDGAGTRTFYSVSPSQPVDAIEAIISLSGNAEEQTVQVFEFCGER